MATESETDRRTTEECLRNLISTFEEGPYAALRKLVNNPVTVNVKEYADLQEYRRKHLALVLDIIFPNHKTLSANDVTNTIVASAIKEAVPKAALVKPPNAPPDETTHRTIEDNIFFILFRKAYCKALQRIKHLQGQK